MSLFSPLLNACNTVFRLYLKNFFGPGSALSIIILLDRNSLSFPSIIRKATIFVDFMTLSTWRCFRFPPSLSPELIIDDITRYFLALVAFFITLIAFDYADLATQNTPLSYSNYNG